MRLLAFVAFAALLLGVHPAEGSAFGYGKNTTGGAGKPTYTVTTLTDSPSDGVCGVHCSIRDAMSACIASGGGNISFAGLSGDINIGTGGGNLIWTCSNSTIDGSTASNQGIQILEGPPTGSSNQFIVQADNVIIRYMRFRCTHYSGDHDSPGCTGTERDVFAISSGSDIWVDHCSMEWGTDSLGDIGDGAAAATDITYSNNLFAESIGVDGGKTILIASGATRISFYRNAFINDGSRVPAIQPTTVAHGVDTVYVDLTENYWYNYTMGINHWAGTSALWIKSTFVGNVFQSGPAGDLTERIPITYRNFGGDQNQGRVWVHNSQNYLLDGGFDWSTKGAANRACDPLAAEATFWVACSWPTTSLANCDEVSEAPCGAVSSLPMPASEVASTSPAPPSFSSDPRLTEAEVFTVKARILASVGATLPCRDALDTKMIDDANSNGTLGPAMPLTAPTTSLPDLTAACP